MSPSVAYLPADASALTGVTDLYRPLLVRAGIVRPLRGRNGRTRLFTESDIERLRWAAERRGHLADGTDVTRQLRERPAGEPWDSLRR